MISCSQTFFLIVIFDVHTHSLEPEPTAVERVVLLRSATPRRRRRMAPDETIDKENE